MKINIINLNVGKKLFLGFLIVSIFTIVVAFSAFHGIDRLLKRNEVVRFSESIKNSMLMARNDEKDYMLSPTDESKEGVVKEIAFIKTQLALLDDHYVAYFSEADKVDLVINKYSHAFEQFLQSKKNADQAIKNLLEQAKELRISFEIVEYDLFDNARVEFDGDNVQDIAQQQINLMESSSGLIRKLVVILNDQFNSVLSGVDDNAQNTIRLKLLDLKSSIQSLANSMPTDSEVLKEAVTALDAYSTQFAAYQSSLTESDQSREQMQQAASSALEIVNIVYENQLRQMTNDGKRVGIVLFSITGLALLVALFASVFMRRNIVLPLNDVAARAQKIASGELIAINQSSSRRDELGVLMVSMLDMTKNLRRIVISIKESADGLSGATLELSDVALSNQNSIQQQLIETSNSDLAMKQMLLAVAQVEKSAAEASTSASHADKTARGSGQVVREASERVNTLASVIQDTSRSMGLLREESKSIANVVDVIKSLSEQTNLLALNAAIEAARAGDQGRGFAVVASEVRTLAGRTQESAEEINQLVSRFSNIVRETDSAFEQSRKSTEEAVGFMDQLHDALDDIIHSVENIEVVNRNIASASAEQSDVANRIGQSIHRVTGLCRESDEVAKRTAKASQNLVDMGSHLKSLVKEFTV